MRPTPLLAAVVVLSFSAVAHAESVRKNLAQAADRLEKALEDNNRSSPGCRNRSEPQVQQLIDQIDVLKPSDDPNRFEQISNALSNAANVARQVNCPDDFRRDIERAAGDFNDALNDIKRRRPGGPPPPPSGNGIVFSNPEVQQGPQGAALVIPTVTVNGMQNQQVYMAWHWRGDNGAWSAWESFPAVQVNGWQFVWAVPYRPIIDFNTLRQNDTGSGRFFVHAGVFDMNGRELQGTDLQFNAAYPANVPQPPMRPGNGRVFVPVQPQPNQPPPPPPGGNVPPPPPMGNTGARDCGLGLDDPGCALARGGGQAMLAPEFQGFIQSLRGQISETNRGAMVRDTLRTRYVTARQFGAILDLFIGENNKLDAARAGAPHVIDPNNALGFSTKFISSSRQREYNALITSQR